MRCGGGWPKIRKLLSSCRGVSTSLLEATATIAVGATLASAAIGVVADRVSDAKIARATAEVGQIADGFSKVYSDTLHYPIFFSGADTGPTGVSADIVRSDVGDKAGLAGDALTRFAIDATKFKTDPNDAESSRNWNDDGALIVDTLEDQLNLNAPNYSRRDEVGGLLKGFNGPYVHGLSPTDPWGNKYYVNSRFLNQAKSLSSQVGSQESVIKIPVFALSAGINETIQTGFFVESNGQNSLDPKGDDIAKEIR